MALPEHESHEDGLAPIEALHSDAMLEIIERIPDFKSIMNLIRASPNACRILYPRQGLICHKLLVREFGPHLPIVVARLEASTAEWKPKRRSIWNFEQAREYSIKLRHFCDRYLSGQATKLQVPVRYFTYQKTRKLLAFHKCVSDWASGISLRMIQQPPKSRFRYTTKSSDRQLNDQERYRVIKNLYVTELISILLPQRYGLNDKGLDEDWVTFWECFAPWEFCQYWEMQAMIFGLLKYLCPFSKSDYPKNTGRLTKYTRGENRLYEILALSAGLQALKPAVDTYLERDFRSRRPLSKLFRVVKDFADYPEIRPQWCCRFNSQWRFRGIGVPQQIFPEYQQIWLKQASASSGDFMSYSLDTTHIEEKYIDSDEGPLACWLYDILRYGWRHDRRFTLRDGFMQCDAAHFLMTSFWDRARWETINPEMPSVAELKQDASTQILTDAGEVVPIPDGEPDAE